MSMTVDLLSLAEELERGLLAWQDESQNIRPEMWLTRMEAEEIKRRTFAWYISKESVRREAYSRMTHYPNLGTTFDDTQEYACRYSTIIVMKEVGELLATIKDTSGTAFERVLKTFESIQTTRPYTYRPEKDGYYAHHFEWETKENPDNPRVYLLVGREIPKELGARFVEAVKRYHEIGSVIDSTRPATPAVNDKIAVARGVLSRHPDWSIRQIAKEMGVHHTTLSRNDEFMYSFNLASQKAPGIVRGQKRQNRRSLSETYDEE